MSNVSLNSPEWSAAREAVVRRDGFRCIVCGCPAAGVDYVNPPRTHSHVIDLANLRTVCAAHDTIPIAAAG